jgi:phage RecT family recombinase
MADENQTVELATTSILVPRSGDGSELQLPNPRHAAAAELWQRLPRLPRWIPRGIDREQFLLAVTAEANRMPENTDASTICAAAFNCAVMGLIPAPAIGHAFFVPFKNSSRNYIHEVSLIVGYKGYLELGYRSGFLAGVTIDVIYEGEKAERWNDATGPQMRHELDWDRGEGNPKKDFERVKAAYCIYHTTAGYRDIVVVGKTELDKLKRKYDRGNMSIWGEHPIAMSKKTAIRRASKLWKQSKELAHAEFVESYSDAGKIAPSPDRSLPELEESSHDLSALVPDDNAAV